MSLLKKSLMFAAGGCGYVGLELLWRGRSHESMFFAGGTCFLLLGKAGSHMKDQPLFVRAAVASGVITAVELATGLLANRRYAVWDYRRMPLNFCGQICLVYSLLWMPVGLGAMKVYELLERRTQTRALRLPDMPH